VLHKVLTAPLPLLYGRYSVLLMHFFCTQMFCLSSNWQKRKKLLLLTANKNNSTLISPTAPRTRWILEEAHNHRATDIACWQVQCIDKLSRGAVYNVCMVSNCHNRGVRMLDAEFKHTWINIINIMTKISQGAGYQKRLTNHSMNLSWTQNYKQFPATISNGIRLHNRRTAHQSSDSQRYLIPPLSWLEKLQLFK